MNHIRDSEPSSDKCLRRSTRQKTEVEVTKHFFKKVYNPKMFPKRTLHPKEYPQFEQDQARNEKLEMGVLQFFPLVSRKSIQFKAIQNYRIKKLKKMKFLDLVEMKDLIGKKCKSQSQKDGIGKLSQQRSELAKCRLRDFTGKFTCLQQIKSDSLEETTIDALESDRIKYSLQGDYCSIEAFMQRSDDLSDFCYQLTNSEFYSNRKDIKSFSSGGTSYGDSTNVMIEELIPYHFDNQKNQQSVTVEDENKKSTQLNTGFNYSRSCEPTFLNNEFHEDKVNSFYNNMDDHFQLTYSTNQKESSLESGILFCRQNDFDQKVSISQEMYEDYFNFF